MQFWGVLLTAKVAHWVKIWLLPTDLILKFWLQYGKKYFNTEEEKN